MPLNNGFMVLAVLGFSGSSLAKPVAGGWGSNEYQSIPACPVMPIECTTVITSYVTITPTVTATVIGTGTQGGQTAIISSSGSRQLLAASSIVGVASSVQNTVAPTYSHGHHHHTSAIGSGIVISISEGSSVIESTGSESVPTSAVSMQSSSPSSMGHHHHHSHSMVTISETAAKSAAAGTQITTAPGLSSIGPMTTGIIPTSSYLQCDHDNCLREFLRHSAVTPFCATYTTSLNTATTGLPTYVSQCQANPSRISSACACISSIAGNPMVTGTGSGVIISPTPPTSSLIMRSANSLILASGSVIASSSPSIAPGTTATANYSHSKHGHHSHSYANSQSGIATNPTNPTNPTAPITPSTLSTITLPTNPTNPISPISLPTGTESNPICPIPTTLFETTTVTTTYIQTITSVYEPATSYPMSTVLAATTTMSVEPNGMTTLCDEDGMPIATSSMMMSTGEVAMSSAVQTGGYSHGHGGHGGANGNGGWNWGA